MGIFDILFDKKRKMDYLDGVIYLFDMVWNKKTNYTPKNILDVEYKLDLVSVVASYLDTKPQPKSVRVASTFGKDCINYGTVHAPRDFKDKFLPKCKERHLYFCDFLESKFNNNLDLTACESIANEICSVNNIPVEQSILMAITQDVSSVIQKVDETLNTYNFL